MFKFNFITPEEDGNYQQNTKEPDLPNDNCSKQSKI